MLLFLISLSFSNQSFLNIFHWIYGPFLLLSPLLTIGLGYMAVKDKSSLLNRLVPIVVSLFGNLPFFWVYQSLNSIWSSSDYLLFIGSPILLGLIANLLSLIAPLKVVVKPQ
jgi:hypothetical protein